MKMEKTIAMSSSAILNANRDILLKIPSSNGGDVS